MKKNKLTLFFYFLSILSISCHAADIGNFGNAKRVMYREVFQGSGKTLYCDCNWQNKRVNLSSCGLNAYYAGNESARATRTEVEHIIPASWMLKSGGKLRPCAAEAKKLKKSARKYCQKHDSQYRRAHSDLVNLYPVVGQINANRHKKAFVEKVEIERDGYGQCQASSGYGGFSPPDDKKGDIARVALYMSKSYGVEYSTTQQVLFDDWNKIDPVSKDEVIHNLRVIIAQGFGLHL